MNGGKTATESLDSPPTSDERTSLSSPIELIRLQDVSVRYQPRRGMFSRTSDPVVAVDRVNLSVRQGHTLGLVGETGSGKSTIAKVIMGMVAPSSGTIEVVGGRRASEPTKVNRVVQVVMQDPYSSLDPRMKIGDIIAEPLTLGRRGGKAKSKETKERVAELLELVGLRASNANRYPNQFSGGQRQRIAVARALAPRPELIVLDEPTSALDVSVKAQILNLLKTLQVELGLTLVIISHDLPTVAYLASEVAIMQRGRVIEYGPMSVIYRSPRHPYTVELLESVPGASGSFLTLPRPAGVSAESLPETACRFAYRCPLRTQLGNPARCLEELPELTSVGRDHASACHFSGELPDIVTAGNENSPACPPARQEEP
jgi:oligopeptide/dipeptide ABC transporter ATP-binding protein